MATPSFLNSIPSYILEAIGHEVVKTEFYQRFASNPQRSKPTKDLYKAIELIEANIGKFHSATIVTCAGDRLAFGPEGFCRISYLSPSKPKENPEAPFTPVELTTGIQDLTVPLESLPMRELTDLFTDERCEFIQCDSNGYIYRDGALSYKVANTNRGYYCDIEQGPDWFCQNRQYSGYPKEIHAHRKAIWIMRDERLFYRPLTKEKI